MSETSAGFSLSHIGQIAIRVQNVERAVSFYQSSLGMPLLLQFPEMAFMRCGEVTLMLSRPESAEYDHPSSILYFRVDDIEAAHRTMSDRGVRFRAPPHLVHKAPDHELWMAFFYDPDDNTLALQARRPLTTP